MQSLMSKSSYANQSEQISILHNYSKLQFPIPDKPDSKSIRSGHFLIPIVRETIIVVSRVNLITYPFAAVTAITHTQSQM